MKRPAPRLGRAAAALAVVPVLVLSACGSSSSSGSAGSGSSSNTTTANESAKGPYTFLYSGDFTGATQTYTQAEVAGLKIAASEINAKGGILGRQINIVTDNDQNDPTTAVNLLEQKLSSGTKIDAMYPGGSSEVTQALLPITTRNKILTVDATSDPTLNNPSKFPYHFGDSESVAQTIPPFVKLAQSKGWKKVAVIYGNDTTGQAVQSGYASALKKVGVDTVTAAYQDSSLDMTPQLSSLQSNHPDALIISSYGVPSIYVIKSRAQMGWFSTPAYGDLITSAMPLAKLLPPAALKNYFAQASVTTLASNADAAKDPALQRMISDAKAMGYSAQLSGVGAGLLGVGFNVLELINYAAVQAHSTDGPTVAKALEHLKQPSGPYPPWVVYFGKYGGFKFTTSNHFPTVNVANFAYVPPGNNNADGLLVPGTGS
ncbi:MAG TPA: ABC transporter substrate-binding protein [Acidimicrobiales bacterium]|nr:ABC transporter substrate-binding protein [Acidimicrobiales bacterium]